MTPLDAAPEAAEVPRGHDQPAARRRAAVSMFEITQFAKSGRALTKQWRGAK